MGELHVEVHAWAPCMGTASCGHAATHSFLPVEVLVLLILGVFVTIPLCWKPMPVL